MLRLRQDGRRGQLGTSVPLSAAGLLGGSSAIQERLLETQRIVFGRPSRNELPSVPRPAAVKTIPASYGCTAMARPLEPQRSPAVKPAARPMRPPRAPPFAPSGCPGGVQCQTGRRRIVLSRPGIPYHRAVTRIPPPSASPQRDPPARRCEATATSPDRPEPGPTRRQASAAGRATDGVAA